MDHKVHREKTLSQIIHEKKPTLQEIAKLHDLTLSGQKELQKNLETTPSKTEQEFTKYIQDKISDTKQESLLEEIARKKHMSRVLKGIAIGSTILGAGLVYACTNKRTTTHKKHR